MRAAARTPTGDEILILADHFLCDFRFFISNEAAAPIDRAEKLFRAYSTSDLSGQDRWAIQEFLYLCECESFLLAQLERPPPIPFAPSKVGTFAKGHGQGLALAASVNSSAMPRTRFQTCSGIFVASASASSGGALENHSISGLFVDHPTAGPSVLVNYDEDVYRQRFTAAHEAAHALFDVDDEYVVSLSSSKHDLREIRANAFAGSFLVPPELVATIPMSSLTAERLVEVAAQLRVNPMVLVIALLNGTDG